MKKKISFFILIMLFVSVAKAQTQADNYIKRYDSICVSIMNTHGIPASIVLGIALHESGAGSSKICKNYNNHFGLKGKNVNSKGKKVSSYRKFDSDEESFRYFAEIVSRKKYYPELRGTTDVKKWLHKIKAAGYATSPTWIHQIEAIIKKYDLTRLDQPLINWLMPASKATDTIVPPPAIKIK